MHLVCFMCIHFFGTFHSRISFCVLHLKSTKCTLTRSWSEQMLIIFLAPFNEEICIDQDCSFGWLLRSQKTKRKYYRTALLKFHSTLSISKKLLASARWECRKESEKPLASQVAMNSASETDKHITRSCSVVQLLPMCRVCDWRMKYLREASRRARPYEIVIMREKQIKIKITRWQNRWKKIKRGIYTEIPWMPHYNRARVHVDVNRHSQRNESESEEKTEIVCRKWKMFGSIGIWCVYCCRMAW